MIAQDIVRKIVFDRRGEIYAKWKKELPLALEIVNTFVMDHNESAFIYSKELCEQEGLPKDSIRIEVGGWVMKELAARANLLPEYKKAMPGALRRARKFLLEGMKERGLGPGFLPKLRHVGAVLSGRHAYRDNPYTFVCSWERDGGSGYLDVSLRDAARCAGVSLNTSRAHRPFRDIRRNLIAWCLGAGRGHLVPLGSTIAIRIDESYAYSMATQSNFVDIHSAKSREYIDTGIALLDQAVNKVRELERQRLDHAYTQEPPEQKAVLTDPVPVLSVPIANPQAPHRTTAPRSTIMEPIRAHGWVATPNDNYSEIVNSLAAIAGINAAEIHRQVINMITSHLASGALVSSGCTLAVLLPGVPGSINYEVAYFRLDRAPQPASWEPDDFVDASRYASIVQHARQIAVTATPVEGASGYRWYAANREEPAF